MSKWAGITIFVAFVLATVSARAQSLPDGTLVFSSKTMIIDIIATIPLIVIAYLCGYYRGHTTAMSVPCARLAERMEEITQEREATQRKLWSESQ